MKSLTKGWVVALAMMTSWPFPACEGRPLTVGYINADAEECVSEDGGCGLDCAIEGGSCSSPRDCCLSHCQDGRCVDVCVNDDEDCTSNQECCSGSCLDGICQKLAQRCLSSGNECNSSDECCSHLCQDGRCNINSSFCSQTDDICADDTECCSGICVASDEGDLGTCQAAPDGPSNCSAGIAGATCDSCNDCCSRLCVPYGQTGSNVCQQAQGCRQTGELCTVDTECNIKVIQCDIVHDIVVCTLEKC